jgi:hypothetical protein
VDEARRVLERLDRIDELERTNAPPSQLLAEVRALLSDAEAWVRSDDRPAAPACEALDRIRDALRPAETSEERGRTLLA